jgi:SAM-dependent methyltransferase
VSGIGSGGQDDRERLEAISRATDESTVASLNELLPAEGHQSEILDVGCGNGSVAIRLAQDRRSDLVWAMDPDLSLVPPVEHRPGNVRLVESTVESWTPPTRFALIHARFVLSHVTERESACRRLVDWLAPGGHLVVTEPVHLTPEDGPDPVRRVLAAYRSTAEADGLSFGFARAAPELFLRAGPAEIDMRTRPARLGGGPGTDRWSPLVRRVEERLCGITTEDLREFYAYADSPGTWDVPQIMFTVVGRKPC